MVWSWIRGATYDGEDICRTWEFSDICVYVLNPPTLEDIVIREKINTVSIFVAVYFLLPCLAFGENVDGIVDPAEYPFSQTFDEGRYELSWDIKDVIVYFAISVETTGWIAVGFEPVTLMEKADMVFGWVDGDGQSHIIDAFSTGPYGPHPPDEELGGTTDIIQFAGVEAEGITTIEFSRHLSTGDEYDKDIFGEEGNTIIWAYSGSDDFRNFHVRSGYGRIGTSGGTEISRGTGWLLVFHNITLSIAFIMMLFAMYVARYMKRKRWWLKLHRRLMIIGVVLSVLGILAVEYIIFRAGGAHFRISHSWLGMIAIVLLVINPFYGRLILRSARERKPFFKVVHRWIGRLALATTLATIIYGLFQIQIL